MARSSFDSPLRGAARVGGAWQGDHTRRLWWVGTALLLSVCVASPLIGTAQAWSGPNAYTLVVLTNLDSRDDLRSTFYSAPAGTVLSIPSSGYEVLTGDAVKSGATFPFAEVVSSPSRFTARARYPYRVVLSDEWEVLEKPLPLPVQRRRGVGSEVEDIDSSELLHCRLPLPQSAEALRRAERQYIALNAPQMRDAIVEWWHRLALTRASQCLYGDGEGGLTGVKRYYELCPLEGLTRIKHELLLRIMQGKTGKRLRRTLNQQPRNDGDQFQEADREGAAHEEHHSEVYEALKHGRLKAAREKRKESLAKPMKTLLERMHGSREAYHAIRSHPLFAPAFETVGSYHPRLSQPHWNAERRAWEMLFPTTNPCATHYSLLTADPAQNAARLQKDIRHKLHHTVSGDVPYDDYRDANVTAGTVSAHDAYWKTVMTLRCPITSTHERFRARNGFDQVARWSITEVRQLCEYAVEVSADVVCGWEHELESLAVNPIPCVVV